MYSRIAPSVGYPPLPAITTLTGLSNTYYPVLISWTSSLSVRPPTNNLINLVGPRTLFHTLIATIAVVRRRMISTKWYYRHVHEVRSLSRHEGSDVGKLPAIGRTAPFSPSQYQCSLINSMRYRNDRQMVPNGTLRGNSLMLSFRHFYIS